MATHSSILAWRIPGTEEPGEMLSMGSHRVGHDWSDLAAAAAAREDFTRMFAHLLFRVTYRYVSLHRYTGHSKRAGTVSFILAFLRDLAWFFPCTGYTAVNEIMQEVKTVSSMKVLAAQSCPTREPMDYSLSGSSVHGILQLRTVEWVAIPFSREPSQPRDRTQVSHIAGRFFTIWATREALVQPYRAPWSRPNALIPWNCSQLLENFGSKTLFHLWQLFPSS